MPYELVLKVAIANSFGNRSLFGSTYQAYRTVKVRESKCSAEIIKKMVKKYKSANREEALRITSNNYANPVLAFMNMKVCFLIWIRYMRIYENCDKDSVDIDSDDFKLSEVEEEEKKIAENTDVLNGKDKQTRAPLKMSHTILGRMKKQGSGTHRRDSRSSKISVEEHDLNLPHTGTLPQLRNPLATGRRNSTKVTLSMRLSQIMPLGLGSRKLSTQLPSIKDEPEPIRDYDKSADASIDDSRQVLADTSRLEPQP